MCKKGDWSTHRWSWPRSFVSASSCKKALPTASSIDLCDVRVNMRERNKVIVWMLDSDSDSVLVLQGFWPVAVRRERRVSASLALHHMSGLSIIKASVKNGRGYRFSEGSDAVKHL